MSVLFVCVCVRWVTDQLARLCSAVLFSSKRSALNEGMQCSRNSQQHELKNLDLHPDFTWCLVLADIEIPFISVELLASSGLLSHLLEHTPTQPVHVHLLTLFMYHCGKISIIFYIPVYVFELVDAMCLCSYAHYCFCTVVP